MGTNPTAKHYNHLPALIRSIIIIVLAFTSFLKLVAQQSLINANPNTYVTLTSSNSANFTNSSFVGAINSSIGLTSFSPLSNVTDENLTNGATTSSLISIGSASPWLQVVDNRATGDLYKAGSYAGFVFTSGSLLGALSTTTVTIQTYLNASPVGLSSGQIPLSNLVKLLAADQSRVGYISTEDFNSIRITFNISGLAIVGSSITVNYTEVAKFVEGPTLDCNTPTAMNLPTYPMSVSSSVNGGVTLLGGITSLNNIISQSTTDFATINPSVGVLGNSITVGAKDNITEYPYPTFVGFDIESASLANLALGGNFVLTAYNNGIQVGLPASGSQLLVGAQLLTGSSRQTIGFLPSGPVDEVRLTLNSGSIGEVSLGVTKVYNAVFRSFCEGNALPCNTVTVMDQANYPVYINALRTGVTGGLIAANNTVMAASNVIDNDANSFAEAKVLAGIGNQVSLSVKKELANFPAGSYAAFEISNTSSLLTADLLNDITITTYLDGNPTFVEQAIGSSGLVAVSSSLLGGGTSRQMVGIVSTLPYDEVVISFNNTVEANTGVTNIYGFYSQNFCIGTINCNGTYWLNSGPPPTGYPLVINSLRTGTNDIACVNLSGVSLSNPGNVITPSITDFATIKLGVDVACPISISVEDIMSTYPAGTIAGFAIRNIGSLVEVGLFNSITIETWNNGTLRESVSGNGQLLNLDLLGSPILGVGTGTYNIGFKTTMSFDEVRISVSSLVNVDPLSEVRVYGAYIDTREVITGESGSQGLTCLVPSITPATPNPICEGTNIVLTASPNNASTYTWHKNNVVIGGATASTFSATESGSYTVKVNATGYSGAASNTVVVSVVECNADLQIVKQVSDANPQPGQNVVFTITVTNNGPATSLGVSVSDLLPTGYTYVNDNGAGDYVSSTGGWTIGNLLNAGVKTLEITAKVNATGNYETIGTVTSTTTDLTPGNNTAILTTVPVYVGTVSSVTEAEGDALVHTITMGGISTTAEIYPFSVNDGTTEAGTDYNTSFLFSNDVINNGDGTITVPAGVSSFTVRLQSNEDTNEEADETYTISVGGQNGTGGITNDDTATIKIVANNSEAEGDAFIPMIILSGSSNTPETFEFSVEDVTTTAGVDYSTTYEFSNGVINNGDGTITVPTGVSSFTVVVETFEDMIKEADETFTINVGDQQGINTITNDDIVAVVSVTSVSALEGNSLVHNITMTGESSTPESYPLTLDGGTATPSTDYSTNVGFSNGVTYNIGTNTVTVPAGVISFTISIASNVDAAEEGPETYNLSVGGVIGTGTILDLGVPDLTPTLIVTPNILNGTKFFNVVIRVTELKNVPTAGLTRIIFPVDSRMTFNFEPSSSIPGAVTAAQNSIWTYSINSGFHVFTTNTVIAGGGQARIGFVAKFVPGATKGLLTLTAHIVANSGGEKKLNNNSDGEKVSYFPQ